MIGYLSGTLHFKDEDHVVIDVAGVGYEVFLTKRALLELGEVGSEIRLEIHTQVGETTFQLYGFLNRREKEVFRKLIGVSGIGPKLGLATLSGLSTTELIAAIVAGDLRVLTGVSGIGKKTAERLVVELKDKFEAEVMHAKITRIKPEEASLDGRRLDALSALVNLGYADAVARRTLQGIAVTSDDSVQSLIKKSLGSLSR